MIKKVLFIFGIVICTACSTNQSIQNITNTAIPSREGRTLSLTEIETAIKAACVYKRWRPKSINDGLIEAEITVRERHSAKVDISYDEKSYSITYKDSVGLDHKGSKIHRNYNKWVILLDKQIYAHLTSSNP